jgi:hypothetical protein
VVTIAVSVMLGPAVGNIAGQVMGNITGVQRGFNFRSFAIAVVTPGIMQGAGITDAINTLGADTWMTKAVTAAAGSVVGQGVAIVVGAQQRFEWRAVAAAAIGGAAGHSFGTAFAAAASPIGENFARSVVTQAVANRGRVNFTSVAADVFGNLLGSALREQMLANAREQQLAAREDAREAAMWQAMGGISSPAQAASAARPPESYWRIMASSGTQLNDASEGVLRLTAPPGVDDEADRFVHERRVTDAVERIMRISPGTDPALAREVAEGFISERESSPGGAPDADLPPGSSLTADPYLDLGVSETPDEYPFRGARSGTRTDPISPERAERLRARGGASSPLISDEARDRGRLLFGAAARGELAPLPMGPATEPASAPRAFQSNPGGAAVGRLSSRLAGDRHMTAPELLFNVALPLVSAATGPLAFALGAGAQTLVNRIGLSDTWTGLALETLASSLDPKRAVQGLGVRAADAGKKADSVAERLQAHVDRAIEEVDTLPKSQVYTPAQLRAMARNPNLAEAYRGNRIDVRARTYVGSDESLAHLQSNYTRGADFVDPKTGRWWDMTTQKQWHKHIQTYGPNGTRLHTERR